MLRFPLCIPGNCAQQNIWNWLVYLGLDTHGIRAKYAACEQIIL